MAERHFRAQPRPDIRVRLRYRRLDEQHTREVDAVTRNIGVGGAFIVVDNPPPPGTPIEIAIASPSTWEPVRVRGEVRWVGRFETTQEPGMGVAFRDLSARDVVALHDFFVSLQFGS